MDLSPRLQVRILWLKTELLHPVDKGGKIRTYNMLKELKRDHFISYMSLDDGSADSAAREQASEYCHELICVPYEQREKFSSGFYAELLLNLASRFLLDMYWGAESISDSDGMIRILSQVRILNMKAFITADMLSTIVACL